MYLSRAADLETDLGYLHDQEAQLSDLLDRLETEHAEFQAKLFQLDAQIDTIARNDRLIGDDGGSSSDDRRALEVPDELARAAQLPIEHDPQRGSALDSKRSRVAIRIGTTWTKRSS